MAIQQARTEAEEAERQIQVALDRAWEPQDPGVYLGHVDVPLSSLRIGRQFLELSPPVRQKREGKDRERKAKKRMPGPPGLLRPLGERQEGNTDERERRAEWGGLVTLDTHCSPLSSTPAPSTLFSSPTEATPQTITPTPCPDSSHSPSLSTVALPPSLSLSLSTQHHAFLERYSARLLPPQRSPHQLPRSWAWVRDEVLQACQLYHGQTRLLSLADVPVLLTSQKSTSQPASSRSATHSLSLLTERHPLFPLSGDLLSTLDLSLRLGGSCHHTMPRESAALLTEAFLSLASSSAKRDIPLSGATLPLPTPSPPSRMRVRVLDVAVTSCLWGRAQLRPEEVSEKTDERKGEREREREGERERG